MENIKNRQKPAPIRFEDALKAGTIKVITDPKEIERLMAKERHEMGYKNHTDKVKKRNENDFKYCDTNYTIDQSYKGMF